MKKCFRCGNVKSLAYFYKHSAMKDGHLNKCIQCAKDDSNRNRIENIDRIRKYDRDRPNKNDRSKKWSEFARTDAGKEMRKKTSRAWRLKNRLKIAAHSAVAAAIKSGELQKESCFICGVQDADAHHEDYSKPLEVDWLCGKHHRIRHKVLRERERLAPF